VRMLSNLETEKSKLIQIVMVGQPNLRTILARPELEQLRQRITVGYHLQPLDAPETCAYVNHRLRLAAIGAPLEFSREVTDIIHRHAEGIPRKINVIADAMLLFGYGEERHVIDVALTREVVSELESTGVIAPPSAARSKAAAVTRQAAVTPPTQQSAHDAELARREAQVVAREQQIAQQQRAMLEEYRRLRVQRDAAAPAPSPSAWPPDRATAPLGDTGTPEPAVPTPQPQARVAPAPAPAPPAIPPQNRTVTPPAATMPPRPRYAPVVLRAPYRPPPSPNVWARIGRALFGAAKPLLED